MWLKFIFLLSLFAISWSLPLTSNEDQKKSNELIQGNLITKGHDLKQSGHSLEGLDLLHQQILPIQPNGVQDETIELKKAAKKPKGKPKPKTHPKKPSHKKPSHKKPSKNKGGKKKSHDSLTGDITWKHKGLTVHGKKDKHGWGINIGKHH